jgi:EmrB/QacA subfamily drug resistance transporter
VHVHSSPYLAQESDKPDMPPEQKSGFSSLTRGQLIGTIAGLQLTLLLAALDQTIVSNAMPKIVAQLNGFERYAWVTTAYLLTSTASGPIFGRLSDLFGRKWFLLGGAALFVAASALCGAAGLIPIFPVDGMTQLILFRALQGAAGGVIMAVVFTVVGDLFPPAARGRYIGLFSGIWALSSMIGPSLGGWITDQYSWRWIFYVNLPVGVIALTVLYFAFPHIRPEGVRKEVDFLGSALMIAFLMPLLLGLVAANTEGWNSPKVLIELAFSLLMMVIFYLREKQAQEPIMPPVLLQNREIRAATLMIACAAIGMFSVVLFVPLFIQVVLGVSAAGAGALYTPLLFCMSTTSALSGQLVSRTGRYRIFANVGLVLVTAAMLAFSSYGAGTSLPIVVTTIAAAGIGLGLTMPVCALVIQNAAPLNMIGAATALSQFCRSIGATLGSAIMGSLMQTQYLYALHKSQLPALPESVTSQLVNPARLLYTKQYIIAVMGNSAEATQLVRVLFDNVNASLTYALHGVFLFAASATGLATLVSLSLRERPLRGHH